jgi:membrane peptidoglycan carboxypeptidase
MSYGDPANHGASLPGTGEGGWLRPPPGPSDAALGTGRVSASTTGRASVGSASVGAHSQGPASRGSAPVGIGGVGGRAPVARAAVPVSGRATPADAAPTGRAQVGGSFPANGGGSGGRAPVGRATVGRASVGRAVPGPAVPGGPGGPAGPGGPGGPGRGDGSGRGRTPRNKKSKRARRRNWIIAIIAVVIMLAGTSLVGGTYFFASIPAPTDFALPAQSTKITFADGTTPMAKLGKENRTVVPLAQIPIWVQQSVIAAEDQSFYENQGVDFRGIIRAAWNNASGGDRQGASTITQQYARKAAELTTSASYSRKLTEAVIAMKLADNLSKDEILYRYLNTVYFGRGAYGIEAAAQAYFLKPVDKLDLSEGMVLAGLIKSPEDPDGKGSTYDRTVHKQAADDRWEYIHQSLIKIKPTLEKHGGTYPIPPDIKPPNVAPVDPKSDQFKQQYGLDVPTGLIVHHVMDELTKLHQTDNNIKQVADLKNSGLTIHTTIDPAAQAAAQKYADLQVKTSPLNGYPTNLMAALVAVEPYTGEVKAYYGGPRGDGIDYAGLYSDPVLTDSAELSGSMHPPASSFKAYTLATGLANGYSLNSLWDGTSPKDFGNGSGRKSDNPVRNAGGDGKCDPDPKHCPLWQAAEQSLNVPFFGLTMKVGKEKVLDLIRSLGIRYIRDDFGKLHDLNSESLDDLKKDAIGNEVGFGQYPITVLEHAGGIAALAARGNVAKVHFIREIFKGDDKDPNHRIYGAPVKLTKVANFNEFMADDEAWALQKVAARNSWKLTSNRPLAAKTGTWEKAESKSGETVHSWTVGYVAPKREQNYNGLAVAVWVGNKGDETKGIKTKSGANMAGATGAGLIMKAFMEEVTKGKPMGKFAEPKFTGDDSKGNAEPLPPAPDPTQSGQPGQGTIPGTGGGNGGPGGPGGTGGNQGGTGGTGGTGGGLPTTPPRRN